MLAAHVIQVVPAIKLDLLSDLVHLSSTVAHALHAAPVSTQKSGNSICKAGSEPNGLQQEAREGSVAMHVRE